MKLSKIAIAVLFVAALSFAMPQLAAAAEGKSADHRQDAAHGHKGHKGGKSADHRQDGKHGHKGHKGGKSADHRQDGDHRADEAGDNGH